MRIKLLLIKVCLLLSLFSANTHAQEDIVKDSLNDFYIVLGTGLGGAVLGLSTLSFVEEPKEHLKNILIGGSMGIIIGVGIVAWNQATKSKGQYEAHAYNSLNFETSDRVEWHTAQLETQKKSFQKDPTYFNYTFSF